MTVARRLKPALVIVLFAVALGACDDKYRGTVRANVLGGTTTILRPSGSPFLVDANIVPRFLPILPVFGFGCPLLPPFSTEFDLFVTERSRMDLFLNRATFRFFDGFGIGTSPLDFPPDALSLQFGSRLIPAGTTRSFRFRPQFGCGLSAPRTLNAEFVLLNAFGTSNQVQLTGAFSAGTVPAE